MRRSFTTLLLLLGACGAPKESSVQQLSRTPVSVRGWILDVKGAQRAQTMEMEIARRAELFASSSVWVEDNQFASGGIAENGAFVVLDVPPHSAILGFNAPGAETARIVLKDIPPSADVFIPDVILQAGGATLLDPKKILVRLPARVDAPRTTATIAKVAGYPVRVIEVPIAQMNDRRDYPSPPGWRPVARVK